MAFYKKTQMKQNNKWYPRSITVGNVTTDQVAERLAAESTVSPADVAAVLKGLAPVMRSFMAQGLTVKLDGVGTFYYTANASKRGVDREEDVTANLIRGVRVRFIPETSRQAGSGGVTRALTGTAIRWQEWKGEEPGQPGEEEEKPSEGGEGEL